MRSAIVAALRLFRHQLIIWLAGEATVVINATIERGTLVLERPHSLVRHVVVRGAPGEAFTYRVGRRS